MKITPLFTEFRLTMALRQVFLFSLIIGAYTLIPLSLHYFKFFNKVEMISSNLETVLGAILSLLLVFRANRAYERWWEARTQWGVLVNVSRNLAIKIESFIKPSREEAHEFTLLIAEFSRSLLHRLRGTRYHSNEATLLSARDADNVPLAICLLLYQRIQSCREQGVISDIQFLNIDSDLSRFMHVTGACEKIKHTLISLSYRSFVHHLMVILFVFLPWKLVDDFGLWSILLVTMIAYITFALEGIARNLEEPFGTSSDDVHMEDVVSVIERSVKQVLLSTSKRV